MAKNNEKLEEVKGAVEEKKTESIEKDTINEKKVEKVKEIKDGKEKRKENLEKMEKARKDTKRKAKEKLENKENKNKETDKIKDEKVNNILKKAKDQGSITYGDLAKELDDVNPEQIDKVFDAFEALGVNLSDDLDDEEPDIEDLKEVEYLKLDEITDTS